MNAWYAIHQERATNLLPFHYRGPPSTGQMPANKLGVHSLPPEALTRILRLRSQERDLIYATHVCRRWRSVLISAHILWTRIPCLNANQTSTYLERSGALPIEVTALKTHSALPNNSALASVNEHLDRVKSLEISPGGPLTATFMLRRPAPRLELLTIVGFPPGHISLLLPRDFLGGYVPSLRTLTWDGSSIMGEIFGVTPALPSPSEMPLDLLFNPFSPLRVLWGLMSSASHLEELHISIDDAVSREPVQDIQLNSLHKLDLISGLTLSRAIPHLKVPQLKELTIFLPFEVGPPTIADLLPSDSYPLLTEVTWMKLRIGPSESKIELRGQGIRVSVVTFAHTDPEDDFYATTSFSFAQIAELGLTNAVEPVVMKMDEFTNLERLELQSCHEEVDILSKLSPSPPPGSFVPCPRLVKAEVCFHNPTMKAVDSLRHMVKSRKDTGKPLEIVEVSPFHGKDKMIDINELNGWLVQGPAPE